MAKEIQSEGGAREKVDVHIYTRGSKKVRWLKIWEQFSKRTGGCV